MSTSIVLLNAIANRESAMRRLGPQHALQHAQSHAFSFLNARVPEGLVFASRRGMMKAGLAGMAGLTLPGLLRARADAAQSARPIGSHKSVILLWMAGGPSHIDTWDPKPDRPWINRGPFGVTKT